MKSLTFCLTAALFIVVGVSLAAQKNTTYTGVPKWARTKP
jgi:hypothetical protein